MMRPTVRIAVLLAVLSPALSSRGAESPPNIVVVLVDDLGVMDTSVPFLVDAEGRPRRYPLNDFYRTPNLERLAARGVRFGQFYAMSVCSPTRVALTTGQNAARHRTTNWINPDSDNGGKNAPAWNWRGLKPGDVTLPALLRARGYRTIHVGKGHFAPRGEPGSDPTKLGFDVNVAGASIGAPATYLGSKSYGNEPGKDGRVASHAVPGLERHHRTDTFLTEALTIEAKARVTEAVRDKTPFFLHFAHYAVHAPFDSDPRFAPHYAGSDRPPQARAFATLVEGMDRSLGQLLEHLEALGVAQDTLVFFLGDNGGDAPLGGPHDVGSSAPLRGRKGSHYEGGMRVPFVAAWAKSDPSSPRQRSVPISPGTVQPQVAAVFDLFPTILGLAGAVAPPGHVVDGRPLDRLLTGRPDPGRAETFLMHYPHTPHRSHHFSVYREGPWKVIYHYFPRLNGVDAPVQLFDLADDPFEQADLASTRPDERRRMLRALADALARHGAQPPRDDAGRELRPTVD